MFFPGQVEALAESRREEMEREIKLHSQLMLIKGQRPSWRQWTARMLRWLGDRMTSLADRLAASAQAVCVEATAPATVREIE